MFHHQLPTLGIVKLAQMARMQPERKPVRLAPPKRHFEELRFAENYAATVAEQGPAGTFVDMGFSCRGFIQGSQKRIPRDPSGKQLLPGQRVTVHVAEISTHFRNCVVRLGRSQGEPDEEARDRLLRLQESCAWCPPDEARGRGAEVDTS